MSEDRQDIKKPKLKQPKIDNFFKMDASCISTISQQQMINNSHIYKQKKEE